MGSRKKLIRIPDGDFHKIKLGVQSKEDLKAFHKIIIKKKKENHEKK